MTKDTSPMLDKAAGKKIRELRRAADKSQEWLGEQAVPAMTYQAVQKYERGAPMRLSLFVRFCEALGADPVAALADVRKATA